jgi:hypothetical protein
VNKDKNNQAPVAATGHANFIGMLSWRIFGPFLFIGALFFVAQGESWFHVWDIAFIAAVLFMILGRYVEQSSGMGRTFYDEPSTWGHFFVYTRNLVILGAVLWIAIKVFTLR